MKTVSGDVVIGVAPGTSAFLDVSSKSGSTSSDLPVSDVPVDGSALQLEIRANTVSGDVRVRRGSGHFRNAATRSHRESASGEVTVPPVGSP